MADDAMEPIVKLAKAAKAVGEPLGFNLRPGGFLAEPSLDNSPHRARLVFDIDTDKVGVDQPESDPALEALWEATEAAEAQRRADEARESMTALEQTLRDPKKGILDD